MEDIIAILLVLVAAIAGGLAIRAFRRNMKKREEELKAAEERRRKATEEYWRKKREAAKNTPPKPSTPAPKLVKVTEGVSTPKEIKPYHSSVNTGRSVTQEVQSFDSRSLLDDVADIAMIAHTVRHWNDNKPEAPVESPREERSVGVSKSESSWGFDDEDSRKSVSSTFSSSWSSSSDSSSSDSGPSSDW